ncbi:hypothetical protein LTR17_019883 [Elasticomyces elasticus]|nr:hypothetical protein LTR17_019883 [Elasticomyces elasticus]
MEHREIRAECVASTGDTFNETTIDLTSDETLPIPEHGQRVSRSNFFREAQFSPDGTTLVTQNDDQCLRTFVLPPDLLDEKAVPIQLQEYASFSPPSNIQSYAVHPFFNLQDPSSTLALHSSTDQALALRNALDYSTIHAKYNLISLTTERYLTTYSLTFTQDGSHFVAGGSNQLSMFDCSRDRSDPILSHKLVPGRKAKKLYGAESLGCKGIVTALAINSDGLLAVGTTQREVGLYADQGGGECSVAFSVAAPPSEKHTITGTGVMHVRWSPDGKYLLAAERQSDGIQVYDVRNMVHRVAWLNGRKAQTTQKLGIDVVPTEDGFEVWAGGIDGCVRMWSNPHQKEGHCGPDSIMALHDDPVSSALWHSTGAVLATCSGRRYDKPEVVDDSDDSPLPNNEHLITTNETQARKPDNKMAIWTVT